MAIQHVATYRAVYLADDEVEGKIIAESIRQTMEGCLELEEGDSAELTQVTIFLETMTAQESADIMRLARNALLRLKVNWAFDLARELDKAAHILTDRQEKDGNLVSYDWSRFITIAAEVYKGKMPIE